MPASKNNVRYLPRPRAKGRARRQQARSHAEMRAERRGHVAQKIAATGTTAVVAHGAGHVRTQPMSARFTERIDALHGQARQVLHRFSLRTSKLASIACCRSRTKPVAHPAKAATPKHKNRFRKLTEPLAAHLLAAAPDRILGPKIHGRYGPRKGDAREQSNFWRAFSRERPVVSSKNATRCRGRVAGREKPVESRNYEDFR